MMAASSEKENWLQKGAAGGPAGFKHFVVSGPMEAGEGGGGGGGRG